MSPTRPTTVDANAWWSPGDNEWILGDKDDNDHLHGTVLYWRPDGTLVNRCVFVHGNAHGEYVRYHESGEVSRKGTLVNGRIHGTDVFFRSESETTESFPSGLHANVWRAELDMVNGSMVAGRLFDKQGRRVGENGELCPERPDTVPEDATYSTTSGRWVQGRADGSQRDGVWRFYATEGWLHQETVYEDGDIVRDTVYANRHESAASLALRGGDLAACEAAITEGLVAEGTDVDRLCLLALRAHCLQRGEQLSQAATVAKQALSDHPPSWGVFTTTGRRGLTASAALHGVLADAHLAEDRGEEALAEARQAISLSPRSDASLYVLKARAYEQLGREDERLSALKTALSIDENLPALASVKTDPVFVAWLQTIDPASMTEEGAWSVLGEAGERLDQFIHVVAVDDDDEPEEPGPREVFDPETMTQCVDHPWDIGTLPACSPELQRFVDMAARVDNCQYRSGHLAVCESTVSAAVGCMDANWLGRIQSIFLPASVVGFGQESLYIASWAATERRTSNVYNIHQDDRAYEHVNASLSAMVVDCLDLDEDDHDFVAPVLLRNRWMAAATLLVKHHRRLSAPLEVLELEPRTHWIVNLLVGKHPDIMREIHLGEGLMTAATREDWDTERGLLQWPHLQAYWLMHHAVFGDHEALREVLTHANRSYPGVAELAGVAEALLAGDPVHAECWNEDRVLEYRMEAIEKRPDLLTEDAKAALERDYRAIFDAEDQIVAALETLGAEEENEGLVNFFSFLRSASGKLDGYEQALAQQDDRDIDYIMAMKNGRVTPFEGVYTNMLVLPEAVAKRPSREQPLRDLFEAAVLRGSTSPDDHANTMPGALVGLAMLTVEDAAGFEAFLARVKDMAFYPEKFGAYRRLQVAVVAHQFLDKSESARRFLRDEVARYSEQFSRWGVDTFDFADRVLTEEGDAAQLDVLCARLSEGEFSGANWKESIGLAQHFLTTPSPVVAPGLKVAVERGLGRHDDGDRATVVRAYARCAGKDSSATIDEWLANISDVRGDCEAAALLAGRIELDVGTDRIEATLARAREVLGQLDKGSMKVGAGLSLLLAVHDHGLEGFDDVTVKLAKLAEEESYGSDALRAAIMEKATEVV